MLVVSIIMFIFGILFCIFSILIYLGKTNLMHIRQQDHIQDKKGYDRDLSKVMLGMALTLILCGFIALKETQTNLIISLVIFIIGFILFLVFIFKVQNKHNGGVY